MKEQKERLSVLAMGVSWGFFLLSIIFVLSIWSSLTGFAVKFLDVFNYLNPNPFQITFSYDISAWSNFLTNIPGILINSFYALVDGLIMGALLAFYYNLSLNILEKKVKRNDNEDELSNESEE